MENSGSPARFAGIKCNGFATPTTKPIIVPIAKPAASSLPTAPFRSSLSATGQKHQRNSRGYAATAHPLDLRVGCRPQKEIADVGDNFDIRVSWSRAQLLPFRVRTKLPPILVMFGHVLKHQHIGQVWHVRTDQCLAEKNRRQTRAAEDRDLSRIKHLNFLFVRLLAVALVSAQLKHPPLL